MNSIYIKTKRLLGSLLIMLCFTGIAKAQSAGNVSGTVVDEQNESLIGVSVQVVGTTIGTITDFDGNFVIQCSPQARLRVSYMGYRTQEIDIDGRTQLSIMLQEDTQAIDEIVVVGYGVQRKSDLTGSVSSVRVGDAMKVMPVSNVTDALQGRLSGVSIISSSGAPNSTATIRVRGVNSFSADTGPLVVIDGFIGGSLDALNPSDILSIEVLKDASATAVYGSRGANGVILVTTKNPEKGKVVVNYNGNVNLKTIYGLPPILNPGEFARLANDYKTEMEAGGNPVAFPFYTADEIAAFDNGSDGFDYVKNVFNDVAIQHTHELSISGGSESSRFVFSGSYNSNEGIVRKSESERANYRLKVDTDIRKWLTVGVNLWGHYNKSQGPRFSQYRGLLIESLIYPNTVMPRNENGDYNNTTLTGVQYNPMGHIEQIDVDGYSYTSYMQGYADFKLMQGLSLRLMQGYTLGNTTSLATNGKDSYNAWASGNTTATATSRAFNDWTNTNILSYVKEFNRNHRINATLVFEQQYFNSFSQTGRATGLKSDIVGHNGLEFAEITTANSVSTTSTILSFMGRVNYALFDRYMLTASYRRDGSSRLDYSNRWEDFLAAALAWNVKQEAFMQDVIAIDQFKLRLGYGETGNQAVAPYSAYNEMTAQLDGNQNLVLSQDRVGTPNLKWERTSQYNAGVDLGFFNNRLTTNIDVYYKMSDRVLLEVNDPNYTGFSTRLMNAGKFLNKGIELTIGGDPFVGKVFSWNTTFTLSNNKTTVERLSETGDQFTADGRRYITLAGNYENTFFRYVEGDRVGTIYGYKSLGVWKSDELADAPAGTIAGSYKYDGNEEVEIGNGQPAFNWGWTNTFQYKDFDFGLFIVGFHGFDIYNYTAHARLNGLTPNPELLNRWRPNNENTNIAGFIRASDLKNRTSQFIEKGDFVKVKSITVGYTIPARILKSTLRSCRVYASLQNPFMFTAYGGIDPEVALKDPLRPGIDYGYYPNGRNYLIGLNFSF